LPELGLCGALLLTKLIHKFEKSCSLKINKTFYWSDSEITINWINAHSSTWTTFVANRVATIQELSRMAKWNHVPSKLNPADLCSRGVCPEKLINNKLWFSGPVFLLQQSDWMKLLIEERSGLFYIQQHHQMKCQTANISTNFQHYKESSLVSTDLSIIAKNLRLVNQQRKQKN
jgi:hypothetical protein